MKRVLSGVAWGALAGFVGLLFDLGLARWMLGFPIDLKAQYAFAYVTTGAALGLLTAGVHLLFRRPASGLRILSWSLLFLWLPPVVDRLGSRATSLGIPSWLVDVGGGLAVLVLMVLAATARGVRVPASVPVLAGLASTAGLAVHRNVVDADFSLDSLHLDAGIVSCAVLIFLALQLRSRKRWMAAAASVVLVTWLALEVRPVAMPDRVAEATEGAPNLILIVADTLRADTFNEALESTPEGAAFRQRFGGVAYFDRLTAVAPWTVPSMGTVLTGLYPSQHGFGRLSNRPARLRKLDEGVPTIASRLRNRGYRTFAWVANPILYSDTGIDRGFDSYRLLQPATTKLPLLTLYVELGLVDEELYQPGDALAERLEESLGELRDAEPFFLWLHLMDPHKPYRPHEGLTPEVGPDHPGEDEALYWGETRFTLAQTVEIADDLDAAGLWQDSAVIFLSDHGEMFESDDRETGSKSRKGLPLNTGHGNGLYEELVHVPLVIRPAGGLERTIHVDRLVSHVDLYDTFGDLIGLDLPAPGESAGYSVAPWLADSGPSDETETRSWSVTGFLQHKPPQRALVGRQLKIIDFESERIELYDLSTDPAERHDLSSERADALAEGLRLLDAYWAGIDGSRKDGEAAGDGEGVDLDEETRRRLEALGYL